MITQIVIWAVVAFAMGMQVERIEREKADKQVQQQGEESTDEAAPIAENPVAGPRQVLVK